MATLITLVNNLLASGKYATALSLIKGFRNGAVYGAKVRFPHALVMTLLFKGGPIRDQAKGILQATFTHSKNLASFVFLYKGLTSLLRELSGKQEQHHSFIAAFIGGYIVFGQYNKINEQINLYLLSRVIYASVRLAAKKKLIPTPKSNPFPLFAALVWGAVLWLFEYHRFNLQDSLRSSMTYLYDDSNVWHSITDFLIYNK